MSHVWCSLSAQSLVILILAAVYQGRITAPFMCGLALYFIWVCSCMAGLMPPAVMTAMQVMATAILTGGFRLAMSHNWRRSTLDNRGSILLRVRQLPAGAMVPQIMLNFRRQDTGKPSMHLLPPDHVCRPLKPPWFLPYAGEWSILTAFMTTCGNALRVFTTLQLTQDPILLAGEMAVALQARICAICNL